MYWMHSKQPANMPATQNEENTSTLPAPHLPCNDSFLSLTIKPKKMIAEAATPGPTTTSTTYGTMLGRRAYRTTSVQPEKKNTKENKKVEQQTELIDLNLKLPPFLLAHPLPFILSIYLCPSSHSRPALSIDFFFFTTNLTKLSEMHGE